MKALRIDPGKLRTRLTLESAVRSPDGAGGHVESWSAVANMFARVEPVSAKSRAGADQTIETVTHRIVIRCRDDVRSGMRFVHGNRVFAIVTVHDPDETGRYLVCEAREAGR